MLLLEKGADPRAGLKFPDDYSNMHTPTVRHFTPSHTHSPPPRPFPPSSGVDARRAIREAPRVTSAFLTALNTFDANVQKGILRVLGCLALHDDDFKRRLLKQGMISRIASCLTSADEELANWAIVLIHDLAMLGEDACRSVLHASNVVSALTQLVQRGSSTFCRLAAETLGFICSHSRLHTEAVEGNVLVVIEKLARSEDEEQQFWAAAMLLSLVSSPSARPALIRYGVGKIMALLASAEPAPSPASLGTRATQHQVSAMAARVLVSLSLDPTFNNKLLLRKVRKRNKKPFHLA
jgi:hypothetical protein